MPSLLKGILNLFHINVKNTTLLNCFDILIKIILILLVIKIIIRVTNSLIERFFQNQKKLRFGMSEKKADTLSELLKSILRYGLYFVAAISIFETVWPNINTTIAFTSVLGVAVGFGSQNLVKDIISGLFILFEDQFAVGDYIIIEGKSGIVEAVGIRATKIRDFTGELHTIPNGSISSVTNKTRSDMRALVEISIAYDEDVDKAIEVLNEVSLNIRGDYDTIVQGPDVTGVVGLSDSGVVLRVTARTYPMKQFELECELRKRIVKAFNSNDIKFGYNKKIIIESGGSSL